MLEGRVLPGLAFLFLPLLPAGAAEVTIRTVDAGTGVPLATRVRIVDGKGQIFPLGPDESLPAYGTLDRFFYVDGEITLELPEGETSVSAGHGFERPYTTVTQTVVGDQTIVVPLPHLFDMRARGWYSGDVHVHTKHQPEKYAISPETAHRIARAEDLAMMWCLDQLHEFTGGPHEVSDETSMLYFSSEYRNQVYGHVSLLGLESFIDWGCCWPGSPAAPTLTTFHMDWAPGTGQAMVLCHPRTTFDFEDTEGWPGNGLGRGLPILAVHDRLDALDLAAYSNSPYVYLDDWYALLGAGHRVPASAGTDASINNYFSGPPGGYRVYVEEPSGHDHVTWVEGLKAGRSFVTNYPLIPSFTVDGLGTFEELSFGGDPHLALVAARIECVAPLDRAEVVVNGEVAATVPLPEDVNGRVAYDLVTSVSLTESSWIALRVAGPYVDRHAHGDDLFAHTNPVFAVHDDAPLRRTAESAALLDWVNDLDTLAVERGLWESQEQETETLAQLQTARAYYRNAFVVPPDDFALLTPATEDTLDPGEPLLFEWKAAPDAEPGDRVIYTLRIDRADLGTGGRGSMVLLETTKTFHVLLPWTLVESVAYVWSVEARDRGLNLTVGTPDEQLFHTGESLVTSVAESAPPAPRGLRVWPNPARTHVLIDTGVRDASRGLRIVDVNGRLVVGAHVRSRSLRRLGADRWFWDMRGADGLRVASGRYWVETIGGGAISIAPFTVIR